MEQARTKKDVSMGSNKDMRVVAICGDADDSPDYLIMIGDDPWTADAIVAETDPGRRLPPYRMQSILRGGYWEDCEHSDELLKKLLAYPEKKIEK